MKHRLLFTAALAADLSLPVVAWLFWKHGALLVMPLFIVCHILLDRLNRHVGKTCRERMALGIVYIISTICAHGLFQWLWNTRVYHGEPDTETIAGGQALILIGLAITGYQLNRSLKEAEQ